MPAQDPHWLAWAAGILDGEGCIRFQRRHKQKYFWWVIVVTVGNTDPRMLLKLRELFGGSISKPRMWKCSRRPIYDWTLGGKASAEMLRLVLPWLIVKKSQAELALASRDFTLRGDAQSKRFAIEANEWLARRIRELKTELPNQDTESLLADLPRRVINDAQQILF